MYANDIDNTLSTTNGDFTVDTGTADFLVTSNDWSVDSGGNLTANNVTANGTLDANGTVTIGDNGDNVTIDSSVWDISSAGVASGLTGITSTGTVDFTGSTSFRIHETSSDPGTCTVGQQYFNTTDNTVKTCTSTNTWTSSTTGTNYVFAYDTTTQTVQTANTFQDITFDTNGQLNGWTHTASSADFTCGVSGLYLVSWNAMHVKTTSQSTVAEIRALFNGTEVAGSQSASTVTSDSKEMSSTFIINATSGQILKLQLTADSTTLQLAPGGSNATTRPSIKMSIIRIN